MTPLGRRFARLLRPVARAALSVFYDRTYLSGRHFEENLGGFAWALRSVWLKNILRIAPPLPWPSAITCYVSNPQNILFHPDDLNNFQSPGTYFQNFSGRISLGRGTYIGPNVGIITANHSPGDLAHHEPGRDVALGERCWIGMNSTILPGVVLGNETIVAAGSVVTNSFPEGHITIGGTPAKPLARRVN